MNPFACLTVLSIGSGLDLFVDPVDQPPSVSDWKPVVVFPVHPEVVAQQEEGLKDDLGFILRR